MWSISSRADYALSVASLLTRRYGQGPVSLKEISQIKKLPYKFLEQIARDLKAGRIITSMEGRNGGYLLARSPKEISMKQVLEAVEDLAVVRCSRPGVRCQRERGCDQQTALTYLQGRLVGELDKISLYKMVSMEK